MKLEGKIKTITRFI